MTVSKEDEYRHPVPAGAEDRLFGDTIWVSVVDPKANIHGIIHLHLTMKNYARIQSVFLIDGVQQAYGNKIPLEAVADQGPWGDGVLQYEVVDPLNQLRITMDGPAYAFNLDIKGRFPVFDYADSLTGDPLRTATPFHGGHYEQGLHCQGQFEIRGGPAKGQVRDIDCFGHRDHSWSDRYSDTPEWSVAEKHVPVHFWPSIQLPDKHINGFGLYPQNKQPHEKRTWGGFISDAKGSRPIQNITADIDPNTGRECRNPKGHRYEITLDDGKVIHVRSTRIHGTIKLWKRAENDVENRLDCYESFCDWEVEETGEVGSGVAEFGIWPVWPQWPL